jgi:formiminotetrahydrofolate cyclodeaminase
VALAQASFTELLDSVGARTPAPGGGAAAALAGAIAAALTEMAAAFAETRKPAAPDVNAEHIRERAATLRARLIDLADEDAAVYAAVLATTDRADRQRALSAAADPPLQIATAAAEIAELASAIAVVPGNEQLLGDATCAVALGEAAAQAAARLVELNLSRHPDDLRLSEVRDLAERAAQARAETLKLDP